MPWQRVELVVDGSHAPALAEALEAAGALSTELTDADAGTEREKAVFGEPGADAAHWPRTRVSALFNLGFAARAAVDSALEACDAVLLEEVALDRIEDADWVALTQQQFQPLHIGGRIWIVPTWYELPDPGAVNVILDPGAAFGTGSHATTRLCLAWLEQTIRGGETILDYGCGSGILGITALKLGAARALGVDIDALAVETARYNATQNGVSLETLGANDRFDVRADITVANILANPLRMLAPMLLGHTRAGGAIALSGILEEQADGVIEAYAAGARLSVTAHDSGWVLLAGRRG